MLADNAVAGAGLTQALPALDPPAFDAAGYARRPWVWLDSLHVRLRRGETWPQVHRLPGHPETLGNLSDRNAIKDLKDGAIALLDHVQLPKHCGSVAHQVKPRCRTSSGA